MFRRSVEKKLMAVSDEARKLRQELGVIDEQLRQVTDEAEDSRLRALVSETPQASADHRDAARAVTALQRDRDAKLQRLAELEVAQDRLLDQLSEAH
jgi:hypothetical protein